VIRRSLQNLMTFPCIRIQVEREKIMLHGAYFGVATGALSILDNESGEFVDVKSAADIVSL